MRPTREWIEKTRAIGLLLIVVGGAVFWLAYSAFGRVLELWHAFLVGVSLTLVVLIGVLLLLNRRFVPRWRGMTPWPERLVRIIGMASLVVALLLILFPYLMDDQNFKNAIEAVFLTIFAVYCYYRFVRKDPNVRV
jgi:hypothetical protein